MDIERIWKLARRAAEVLPGAPESGDVLSWLSWRELVWDTAYRLGEIGSAVIADLGLTGMDDANTTSVSATQLLRLAVLVHTNSGEVHASDLTAP
ncbi:hypothetical protein [Prauserella cavernicola]|uniref:Uncharacterized protein n=1 Tax=Prauserella cavernicola TaxID=2800127 RepID=A0A934QV86_9PSEU|nr:hypothetical protein [Prauserella cavernicola]MBK1787085.1 hypothetical protein [Prauserella cavernicola]